MCHLFLRMTLKRDINVYPAPVDAPCRELSIRIFKSIVALSVLRGIDFFCLHRTSNPAVVFLVLLDTTPLQCFANNPENIIGMWVWCLWNHLNASKWWIICGVFVYLIYTSDKIYFCWQDSLWTQYSASSSAPNPFIKIYHYFGRVCSTGPV